MKILPSILSLLAAQQLKSIVAVPIQQESTSSLSNVLLPNSNGDNVLLHDIQDQLNLNYAQEQAVSIKGADDLGYNNTTHNPLAESMETFAEDIETFVEHIETFVVEEYNKINEERHDNLSHWIYIGFISAIIIAVVYGIKVYLGKYARSTPELEICPLVSTQDQTEDVQTQECIIAAPMPLAMMNPTAIQQNIEILGEDSVLSTSV